MTTIHGWRLIQTDKELSEFQAQNGMADFCPSKLEFPVFTRALYGSCGTPFLTFLTKQNLRDMLESIPGEIKMEEPK